MDYLEDFLFKFHMLFFSYLSMLIYIRKQFERKKLGQRSPNLPKNDGHIGFWRPKFYGAAFYDTRSNLVFIFKTYFVTRGHGNNVTQFCCFCFVFVFVFVCLFVFFNLWVKF